MVDNPIYFLWIIWQKNKIKEIKMSKNECKSVRKIKLNILKWSTQNKFLENKQV